MQYYASHYLWHAGQDKLFRMQRIGLEVSGRTWVSMEPLEEEVRNTQWLGGLIVLAASDSELRKGETFQEFRARTVSAVTGDQPLYAFHVPFLICRRWNLPNEASGAFMTDGGGIPHTRWQWPLLRSMIHWYPFLAGS